MPVPNGPKQANVPEPRQVLIVEDDDDSRDLLRELIDLFGHRAVSAKDAHDAIRQVSTVRPDVAFIDIGLPGIDGFELARMLRTQFESMPIRLVALTGYSDRDARDTANKAGFDDFMVKPVMPEVLEQLLATTPRRKS